MEIMGYYGDSFPLCYTHAGRAAACRRGMLKFVRRCEEMQIMSQIIRIFTAE